MLPELDNIAVRYIAGGHIQPDNVSVRIVM
jgi:hypothetical protein